MSKSPLEAFQEAATTEIPVDYFQFYKSVSSVYSSKIEGEDIDFDSHFKHRFLNVSSQQSYTQKADDLYSAYEYIDSHRPSLDNTKKAHELITRNLLPTELQGKFRHNPMFVLNDEDKIEYVAYSPFRVEEEITKLFDDITVLLATRLDDYEIFFYASQIHLVFVKIHPF